MNRRNVPAHVGGDIVRKLVTCELGSVRCPYAPNRGRCDAVAEVHVTQRHSVNVDRRIHMGALALGCDNGTKGAACHAYALLGGEVGSSIHEHIPAEGSYLGASMAHVERALRLIVKHASGHHISSRADRRLIRDVLRCEPWNR